MLMKKFSPAENRKKQNKTNQEKIIQKILNTEFF